MIMNSPPRQRSALLLHRVLLACLLLWLPTGHTLAQALRGMPLQREYSSENYNATPSHPGGVTTDAEGRVYIGNVEGVLRYDGSDWQRIELPGKSPARALVTAADGRIYVGGFDTYGWLVPGNDGSLRYEDLRDASGLKAEARQVGTVWETLSAPNGVYFRTEHSLHYLAYDRKTARQWPLGEKTRSFYVSGTAIYARIDGLGFSRFEDGKFFLEPGGEVFASQPLAAMISRPGWRLLVGENGLYRASQEGIVPLPGQAGVDLRGAYVAQLLSDGSFVVGTNNGELLRFGADYRLRDRIPLGSYAILSMAVDREGGLWTVTETGLLRLSVPSPWSFFGSDQGLRGVVLDTEWYGQSLWLGTSRGFARMSRGDDGRLMYEPLPYTNFEAYALLGTDSGLLLGHRNGLKVLDPGSGQPRNLFTAEAEGVYFLRQSSLDPDLVYGVSELKLWLLRRIQGRWNVLASPSLNGASVSEVVETGPGEIWLGDSRGGPQRWKIELTSGRVLSRETFGGKQGLVLDPHSGARCFLLDGKLHAVSGDKGFVFDGKRFTADAAPPMTLVDRPNELAVLDTPLGTYAYTSRQLWLRRKGENQWQQLHLGAGQAGGYSAMKFNRDGVLRLATWDGLLQYQPGEKTTEPPPLKLGFQIARADNPDNSGSLALPLNSERETVKVPSGYRLHFRFDLVSMESGAEFRYFIHGAMDDWSDWSDPDLYIQIETPGDYVLDVQARTRNGRVVPAVSYRFSVLPRWYQQWWVRTLGLGLALAVIAALLAQLIRRRTERYMAANQRLEARISERTRELEEANRKLSELATEDSLTGVANRRALELGMRREWYRALDQRRPLSVLMIDVDHFKRYNDQHGHLEGDVLLRSIAQRLQSQHDPKRELLARYGGEEFALLLPGLHRQDAAQRAEQLRELIASCSDGVTISIGVAGLVPSVQDEPNTLLRRADQALYRAKRAGRNRVECDDG